MNEERKEALKKIKELINKKNLREDSEFKLIARYFGSADIEESYVKTCAFLMNNDIDCQSLVDCSVDYKENKITLSEFKECMLRVLG